MGYLAIGDVTPAEARIAQLTSFIVSRRKLGQSDSDIRTYLRLPGPLPASHPCASASGQNLCAEWEVTQAFGNASLVSTGTGQVGKAADDGGGIGSLLTWQNVGMVAGALAVVGGTIWFLHKKGAS